MLTRLLTLALALLGSCPAQDNTQVITLPAPPASAAGRAASTAQPADSGPAARTCGLMWKVTSATSTVYLVGSLHFGSADMYPLPEKMESAFRESSVLAVELDPAKAGAAKVLDLLATAGTYPAQDTLWNHISGRTRSQLSALAAGLGLNAETFSKLKPWAVDFILSAQMLQATGMRPDLGIDMHFLAEARGGKRIEELETMDQQMRAVVEAPESEHIQALEEAVADPERAKQVFANLKAAWMKGDAAALAELVAEEFRDSPGTRKRMLDDRNVSMTAAVERMLKGSEPCFVVVGSAHLIGQDGIVSRLVRSGFSVKRVLAAN
jgi:uncharacterized protein YbaP (TraB family)